MHDHADHTMGLMLVMTAVITGGIMVAGMLMSNSGGKPSAGTGVFLVAGLPIMMLMIIAVVVAYMVMGFILGTIARPPRI
jgi:hypothetical protein